MPEHSSVKVFREVFRRVLLSSLGESAGEAALFFLRRSLGCDPFEVFWDNPGGFYRELEKIFGVGTKVLIRLLASRINSELGLNIDPERFLELMRSEDRRSAEEIRSLIMKIAELYEGKRESL
ncbi:MAG: hypothetical protein QXF59_05365 [Candidatus Bathyarchaeia archaeon]|nr:hypothetical protein [Candidatus Bathyarchaeota archaeon]